MQQRGSAPGPPSPILEWPQRDAIIALPRALLTGAAFFLFLAGCTSTPTEQKAGTAAPGPVELNTPLSSFSQNMTSPSTSISGSPGQLVTIPVTMVNTEPVPLSSAGTYPVTVSYKWFQGPTMLPSEGERTLLPQPHGPGDQESFTVRVRVPDQTGDLRVKISLVQEGVAWFIMKGATPLELRFAAKP